MLTLLQAGTIRQGIKRGLAAEATKHGTGMFDILLDILSSGWFWAIVGFAIICIIINAVVNNDK